ncbi:MAG: acyltransferase [Pseudomonadota bacterium]
MRAHHWPRLRLLPHSQLGEDSWHSLLISMLRGLAAIEVAAAHLRAQFYPGLRTVADPTLWFQALSFVTGFAHQAVVVFFLISGWLVGGSLLNKLGQPDAIKLYALDRLSRLWTVLVPTFVLILAIGIVTSALEPRSADFSATNEFSALSLLGNLAGLQTVYVPEFGGNFPLWSLANETWYYVMFPLLLLCLAPGKLGRRLGSAAALLLSASLLTWPIVLYFAIWLLGAAASRVRLDCGWLTRAALLLILAPMSMYFRLFGNNDDAGPDSFLPDLLMSVVFLLFLCSTVVRYDPASRLVQGFRNSATFFSNFSFTLYVVHVPVYMMLGWLGGTLFGRSKLIPNNLADVAVYAGMLLATLVFAYGFYRMFEARTCQVRRWLRNMLLGETATVARVAPAKH